MRKFLSLIAWTTFLMTVAMNSAAQNRCVLNDGHGSIGTITYSDQMMIQDQDLYSGSLIAKTSVVPQQRGNAPTHTLNVLFPEECNLHVYVSDGTSILAQMDNMDGEQLTVELEEGTYSLFASGRDYASDRKCIWVMDNLELVDDAEIKIDLGQCVYSLSSNIVDENGNAFKDMEILSVLWCLNFYWLGGVQVYDPWLYSPNGYEDQMPDFWYSPFDERSALELTFTIEPGNQKSYFVTFPKVYGLSDDYTFANDPNDFTVVNEVFHLNEEAGPSYYVLTSKHFCRFLNGATLTYQYEWMGEEQVFDPASPFTIVSNLKIGDPTAFESGSDILIPSVYESYDWGDGVSWYHDCYRTPFYIDKEGSVVREALPYYEADFNMVSIPNWFPETPAMTVQPSDQTTYFGERTPLSSYNPIAFNAETIPLGLTAFLGNFYSSGENSCERVCDYDQQIMVQINGEEVFNDSLYLFNKDANTFMPEVPAPVVIEVANRHLSANDVPKSNYTHVEFNLENEDAIPPTMTFLRVLNAEGKETIQVPDINHSSVVFGCADFTFSFDMEYFGFLPAYNARPNVEVQYSLDGVNWIPLDVIEDENLFHENHGNVFVADLSQLDSQAANHWVSCKFIITDEVGNSQVQELTNLFFVGELESVSEQVSLEHTAYPNPFTNEVRITTANAVNGPANIQVYNVLGAQVYQQTVNCTDTNEFTIKGSALKPGIYFYQVSTEEGMIQGRIVKE